MSDFARFAAAALRDKTLSDLLDENEALRKEKHELEYVQVTGPNRQPVYAQGHLRDNKRSEIVVNTRVATALVDMKQITPCILKECDSIELWVNGCLIGKANEGTTWIISVDGLPLSVASNSARWRLDFLKVDGGYLVNLLTNFSDLLDQVTEIDAEKPIVFEVS